MRSTLIPDDSLKGLLLQKRLLTPEILANSADLARSSGISLQDALIEREVLSQDTLTRLTAEHLKLPYVSLSSLSISEETLRIIPENVARRQKVIAFSRTDTGIKLAMADPRNQEIPAMVTKKTGLIVTVFIATERDIVTVLHLYRKDLQKAFDELIQEADKKNPGHAADIAPVSRIVDLLFDYAYQDNASDIHIEAEEINSLVRFRIDGILHDVLYLPRHLHERIVARIKVLSKLRTDEHLSPQDGKIRVKMDQDNLDIRVSILPVVDGEKIVLRLLSSHFQHFTLGDLGMYPDDLEKVTKAFKKPYGMILSTGPTGSGKSTSIYAILKILNTKEKNITTIEDPVEYKLKGLNQIQVNVKTNLTFASGLRSILRQDPNIIFVGEIRDGETAAIAVNAALTGHLVLSTLHTNDAATALPRLIDMKIEPFLVASTVNVIIAQRLVRKICQACKTPIKTQTSDVAKLIPLDIIMRHLGKGNELTVYKGQGCRICRNTGYKGRVGLFEVLEITKRIKDLITEKQDSDVILKQAIQDGMHMMLEDGLRKVADGMTTLEEVMRVTKVESL